MSENLPTTEKKDMSPAAGIRSILNKVDVKKRFEDMLGNSAASFMSSIISAVSLNKALSECDPTSVVSAAAVAASLGLPINASLGFAHIVPYNTKIDDRWVSIAQFQMGWKGFVQLALRSGQYKTINVVPVREGQIKRQNTFTGEIEFNESFTSPKVICYTSNY